MYLVNFNAEDVINIHAAIVYLESTVENGGVVDRAFIYKTLKAYGFRYSKGESSELIEAILDHLTQFD